MNDTVQKMGLAVHYAQMLRIKPEKVAIITRCFIKEHFYLTKRGNIGVINKIWTVVTFHAASRWLSRIGAASWTSITRICDISPVHGGLGVSNFKIDRLLGVRLTRSKSMI